MHSLSSLSSWAFLALSFQEDVDFVGCFDNQSKVLISVDWDSSVSFLLSESALLSWFFFWSYLARYFAANSSVFELKIGLATSKVF